MINLDFIVFVLKLITALYHVKVSKVQFKNRDKNILRKNDLASFTTGKFIKLPNGNNARYMLT